MNPFSTIDQIPSTLLERLRGLGFTHMTDIQQQAIPAILSGKDLLAQSATGSGKTLAFGIPLLTHIDPTRTDASSLVITPTRELASQVADVLRTLGTSIPNLKIVTLYGGVPLRAQAEALAKGADILVGTPGRIIDHLGKSTLSLQGISTLVLDEADRMLDMGFYDAVHNIASHTASGRQTLLFSATFTEKIERLSKEILHTPLTVKIEPALSTQTSIQEIVHITSRKRKTLERVVAHYRPHSTLIFCNTKAEVISLEAYLKEKGHDICVLHGEMEQREREEAIILFSNGSKRILVATDVASRGLDIEEVSLVINYDLPFDKEIYTHRIGRTGRAGASGMAVSFYADGSDKTAYILERAQETPLPPPISHSSPMTSGYTTLCISGGKREKLRAGDILGTLCKEIGIQSEYIGKITLTPHRTYVALRQDVSRQVVQALKESRIKKRRYKAWLLV